MNWQTKRSWRVLHIAVGVDVKTVMLDRAAPTGRTDLALARCRTGLQHPFGAGLPRPTTKVLLWPSRFA